METHGAKIKYYKRLIELRQSNFHFNANCIENLETVIESELTEIIHNTLDFCGNTHHATVDYCSENEISGMDDFIEHIKFNALQSYGEPK